MSEIVRLSYDVGGALDLRLYDPGTSETPNVSAVQVEPITMLAVDSAFERRTPVHIYVDEHKASLGSKPSTRRRMSQSNCHHRRLTTS